MWLETVLSDAETIGLSWQVMTAFVRIGTNPKLFAKPLSINQVENTLGLLIVHRNVKLLSPSSKHWQIFVNLLKATNAQGNLVMDAHLAALAIENNARLASTDTDFKLFRDLDYFNPLTEI